MDTPLSRRHFLIGLMLTAPGCARTIESDAQSRTPTREPVRQQGRARRTEIEEPAATHPRLFVTNDSLNRLRQSVKLDPILKQWHDALAERAEKLLREDPIEPPRGEDDNIIQKSRAARHRIADLAGLYLVNRDERLARRAREEMLAASSFPDWNPRHFLDTAEMTFAMSVGYDWLYDFLSPEDRRRVYRAIINLGLRPALNDYRREEKWTKLETNWAFVCNGGIGVGALAIAGEDAKISSQILSEARPRIARAMQNFSPDGGYPEGPGYWNYATTYATYFLAAAETSAGQTWNLENSPGFTETGLYRIHAIGPAGKQFNYGDAIEKPSNAPQMFWMATRFKMPAYADHEEAFIMAAPVKGSGVRGAEGSGVRVQGSGREEGPPAASMSPSTNAAKELHIFHLLWHPAGVGTHPFDLPTDRFFRGVDVATFRSSWTDPDALYVGFKGGNNKFGHSHLDLGSFVVDAFGERFAVDLGPEDYSNPGYFRGERQSYLRVRTEAHNTITINHLNQDPEAHAPIIAFESTPARSHAVADLTNAYFGARKVLRGIAVLNGNSVLIQDELDLGRVADVVTWTFLTEAEIQIDGTACTLTQNGRSIRLQILSPEDGRFSIESLDAMKSSKQPTRAQKLLINLRKVRSTRIAVFVSTSAERTRERLPALVPLQRWGSGARR